MSQQVLEGYRLSPQQRRLFVLHAEAEKQRLYGRVRLRGPLDATLLTTAFEQVVSRHESLRTSFHVAPGMELPLQIINEECGFGLEQMTAPAAEPLSEWAAGEWQQWCREEGESAAGGLRVRVLHGGEREHELWLSVPELCADRRGLENLVREVAGGYEQQLVGGRERIAEDEPAQYLQFSEWQNELLETAAGAEGRAYWQAGAVGRGELRLPLERAVREGVGRELQRERIELSAAVVRGLAELSEKHGSSLEELLLGSWYLLLWRLTGETEIEVEVQMDGRKFAETEKALGHYDLPVPVRLEIVTDYSVIELLEVLRTNINQARGRQEYYNWEEHYATARAAGERIGFSYSAQPGNELGSELEWEWEEVSSPGEGWKLELRCERQESVLVVEVSYESGRYEAAEMQWLVKRYERVLAAIAGGKQGAAADVEIVSEEELEQQLVGWNQTTREYESEKCIQQLFEAQVERTPEAVAVVYEDKPLSYAQLNERANQLAHYLRGLGVGPEVLVGICVERSIEMVVAMLATLKAGGAYLPLDPDYPLERLALMIDDSGPSVVLTLERIAERLPAHCGQVYLDTEWEQIAAESSENPECLTTSDNLCYVIYTSGSTGRPKGVTITHENLINSTTARAFYHAEPGSRFLLLSSFAFDSSVAGIFGALCCGATLWLPREGVQRDIEELARLIAKSGISCLLSLPSLYALLLEYSKPEQMSSLRAVIVAGESCPVSLVERHFETLPQASLFNEYGPTEATVWSTVHECRPEEARMHVPIGRPIANTQIYLIDAQFNPVAIGIAGELCIGGVGLSRGYLQQPGLTAEKFVPHPFAGAGARLYRTGDLARFLSDGSIEFLGRVDDQVKIRGYRIELGEIEALLRCHPHVRDSMVIVNEAAPGKQLVAYFVPAGKPPAPAELRNYFQQHLPEYMIPALFVQLSELPLTPNGKVDRRAMLPKTERKEDSYEATQTPLEEIVAGIWSELLGVSQFGRHDNFFEMGGHSLLATQFISRVREVCGVGLAVRVVFESPTLAELAQAIEAALRDGQGLQVPVIVRGSGDTPLPLSFAQQRLWFIDQLEPGSHSYNIPAAVRLSGELNVMALEQTLSEIVKRHESLRTSFTVVGSEPVQVIAPAGSTPLLVTDLSVLADTEREAEARRLTAEEARAPFELSTGPLFRAQLLRLSETEHILLCTMHHVVSDGWSMGVLIREVAALYHAFSAGEPSPLKELTIQYADFAAWQREWLTGEVLESQLSYWKQQLQGAPAVLELPTDRPRPAVRSYRGARHSFQLSEELSAGLKELSRREGATLFMVLLAAFDVLLSRYTGQDDIVVGTPVAGRNHREIESLIGFFINTLVLRVDLSAEPSFREVVRRVREVSLGAYAHQDIPFEKLVEELQPERALSHQPLFQVVFTMQNAPREGLVMPGLQLQTVRSAAGHAKFDLQLTMVETGGRLGGTWSYSTEIFEAATIQRLEQHFQQLLQAVVAEPEAAVCSVALLNEAEREQQLVEWNQTGREYESEQCIQQLFEAQVERTPEAVAVVYEAEQISYAELNERANQLAHYLRGLGVGPEVLVGICVERSLEMVVGVLGILKAGGAYVPLDADYPLERLSFMLEDAGVGVLLTQARLEEKLPAQAAQVVCLDSEWEQIAEQSTANPECLTTAENLCYVIYTSGSTGRPKGVEIEQRGLVNYVNWSAETYPFGAKGRTPVHSSLSFDLTVTSLYVALVSGGCLELVGDPRFGLSAALEQGAEFNVLKLTPGQLQLLNLEVKPEAAGRVKALVLGGENLLSETVTKWLERSPDSRVFNEYGPTETVVGCCIYEFKAGEEAAASVPIGGAIANSERYILDERGALLPLGASGEIYIGGAGVGRGYLQRPDLTAERFVPHPYSTRGGERLYRTGDVGRYRASGTMEYLGRLDQQVKVRGYRVELGEVEAVLSRHSGVQECVVVAREEESGDKRLVAYVVTDSNLDERGGGPERPLYQMPNDLKVAHLNKNETDFVYQEIFKNECYLQHGITLNDGDCVFDVGANIGLFTLFINQRCAKAQVYAFEPVPATFEVLRTNVELYGLNVKLFNCGLFSEPTTLKFTHYPRMSVMSGAFADPVTDEDVARITMQNQEPALSPYADGLMAGRFDQESYDCQVRTISGVMREEGVSRIDLLKIDVEKSELEVLKGIAEEDWQKIRQIVVEVHDVKGEVAEVEQLLEQHGFKFVTAQDAVLKGTGIYDIYAVHPARQRPVSGAAATATELLDLRGGLVNTLGGEMRRYLQEQLPEYMVPSAFVQLSELPLTRNGKVDRGALPAPEQMQATSEEQYVAPRTAVEELIAGIWSEVLKVERLGRTDNFFDLGGHSLLATQVISRVREVCGVELAVRVMFESPTVAQLAQAIEAALREEQGLKVPAIVGRASETAPPLSFAQQRLWFIDQLEPGSHIYNIPAALRLSGELNVMALEQTLSEIVSRHEVLRTSFTVVGSEPVQVIAPVTTIPLPVTDLSTMADDEREAEARRLVGEEARAPFDLSTGPLFRAQLLRLSDSEHVLLCTMHHVVSDGWSMGVLIREVAALYQAYSAGEPSPLKELTIQYADFAAWQREWLTGEALEKQLTYWKGRFGDTLPLLELPTDRPHPIVRTYRGDHLTFDLGPEVSAGLKEMSRREGATLFMVLLAGFKLLLSRYCGQDDIVVGTAIANRNHREIEELIGFFVNTLVMRTDLSGDPSFLELVSRVRDVALGAYTHQDVPFEKLVEDLMPERNLSYQPLFQVMFALQNVPAEALEMPGLILTSGGSQTTTARFDLVLAMKERSNGIYGSMEYSTELFDHSSIQRLVGHFQSLLAAVIAAPDQPISTFALLDEREREQQLVEWNQTGREYASESCVQQLFEAQVERTPEAVAVVYEAEQISYAELNERANQLAHYLRGLGVGPEVLVGICVERSIEMVVGVLGILKAGGAYVPLDAEYPLERLSFMLEDAGVGVLLTQARLEEKLPAHAAQVVCLDSEWEQIAAASVENPECLTTAENLCYVIYTSGSTGEPKGVLIPHRGVTRLLCNVSYVQLDHTRVLLQLAPLSFDASTFELWGALLHGGSCVLWAAQLPSAGELRAGIARYGITTMWLTASLFNAVVDEEEAALGGLKQLLIGGEALSVSHVRRARAALPEVEIINGYGPTESTTFSCCESIGEVESGARGIPIGRAIANTEVYVLDQGRAVVPVGVVGELYIGGAGLARGYLNQPELTAEKFVKHPFSEAEAARLYRTGDLVRYLSDGRLEFVGRLDSQVKVRGYRIELGEIETVLSRHSGVQECVVVAREEENGDKRLVAYVVSGVAFTTSELRSYLQEKLPEYMVPAAFVELGELPLTSSGKINRRALPAPTGVRPELESNYVTPRSALEELVTGIWSEVLGVELVGIHDNFFDLGGHSLLATQVISRIRETFRVEVPLRYLFESPTVAGLALDIAAATGSAYEGDAPPITPAERHENLPLSFAQQRLWFIHQLEPNNSFYNIATAVRLSGDLDIAALEQTLSEILRRHESLRTSFTVVGSEPVQVIAAVRPISLSITDLSVMAEAEREAEAHRLAGEEAREPFDLSTGPLFRAQLLRLSETEHVLLCTMHHVVSDGWSMGVLIREVGSLYQAFSAREPSPLPELNIQYPDFAAWQRQWLTGEVLESQLSYWKQQLQGAPAVLELPTDRPRPAVRSYRGAQHSIKLSEELSAGLKELSRREGATLFMVLLAAFDVLLSRYTGQEDIVVGSPIANRNRAETEALIGFFVNTLVLRTDLSGSPTFRELLGRVREVSLGAYAHQDIPFEKLVEELQPQRDLSRSPLFQVMFVLQNAPSQVLNLSRLTLSGAGGDAKTAKFDLTLMMMEQEAGMTATWIYNTDIFEASRIERLAAHFQTLLERLVLGPEQRVTEVLLVSEEEREQQLVDWNQTAREYASESCLQQLFEAQVERTPEATAVVYESEQLTYSELNARANQLAHYLRELGVGPEVLVGLCLERSLEMLVGVLGILKAGGAYVPLDPSNPAERLGFMLADAGVTVLVTQSHLLSVLPEQAAQIVCVDGDWPEIAKESEANPACLTTGENLCYVIYTSGSTGKPKGVLIPHRALVNYSCAFHEGLGEPRPRSYATVSTFAADLGHTAIFPALCTGAVVHVMAQERVMDGARMAEYFAAHEVECMKIVPSHLRALFGAEGSKVLPRGVVVVGGEGLRWEWARAWAGAGCRVLNHYGPTECTVGALMGEVGAEALAGAGAGLAPLGRALGNTEVYVLDKGQAVVPVGVVGELYIGGAGLARGYLNQPELTAEKFVKHPFSEDGEARLYRTGDLVRYLSDGRLEFVGRLDHQVKVRGYRVELGEVETALNRHSGVKECVVVAREEESGDKRLVAYVVSTSDVAFTPSELRSYLQEKLPEYMVPSAFVELAELPLTRNGKVDRQSLPAPDYESQKLETAYLAPRTPTEERVAAIWSEVLRIELVSTDSNFFEIGGHSLLATQVVSRLREACRIELPLRKLFEFPTVAGLSLNIDQMQLVQDYEDPSRIRIDPRITKTIDQLLAELN